MTDTDSNEQDRELFLRLQKKIADRDIEQVRDDLAAIHPSKIAHLLESLPSKERDKLWALIDLELEGDVLSHAHDGVRSSLLESMPPQEVAQATESLDADDVADILQDLPSSKVDQVLRSMDAQNRQRVTAALSYAEDTAGGLMNPDVITVRDDVELDVVLRYMRLRGHLPENTDSLIVVARDNQYLGLLPLTTVLTGAPEALVKDIMDAEAEVVTHELPTSEVAKLFEQRDLLSVAVVDAHGTLLGRITVDDVVDVIRDQGAHPLMSLAGLDEEEDMFASVLVSAERRALWLGVNLATAFLAAGVIGLFEATIEQIVALAILMPVVASMGGIAGSQTLTLVIRGLALGQVHASNAKPLLYKELMVALINGTIWAAVVSLVVLFWFQDIGLSLIIGLALIINIVTAALAGAVVPLALQAMRIDPALAGGVVLTTVTDVVGFVAFLGLATIYLI